MRGNRALAIGTSVDLLPVSGSACFLEDREALNDLFTDEK